MAENRAEYAEILKDILNKQVSFNVIKNEIERNDRGFMNMLFMTTFRQLTFIKTEVLPLFVKKKIPQKQKILEYLLYLGCTEILFMNTPDYAIINSYVDAAKIKTDKFGANFINAVLRNVSRQKNRLLNERKSGYFSKDFLQILKQDYTPTEITEIEKFAAIEPPLDITVKSAISWNKVDSVLLPTGSFRLPANTKVMELSGFQQGEWWVQDAASAVAVKCLTDLKGKRVLDLCAAPGGKTAQLLDAGAIVTAVDISETRLSVLVQNMERLNLTKNLTTICADALSFLSDDKFDIILVDAPCSATGTFRRHPEMMHTKTLSDIKKQANLQKKILEHALSLLAPHGCLLYATCSLAKIEGERQINQFIKAHQEIDISPISLVGTENMCTKEGFLRILPQHLAEFGGIDGFFVALLKRKN
ncbi:MAG: RsmB/NOP family class I SAM-dependent RNA methyltransferase [Acetobacter sp.]|nr:RsmB/NOP family class I SAM-dependent RNA methyltransferase [Acetobacter sp.]